MNGWRVVSGIGLWMGATAALPAQPTLYVRVNDAATGAPLPGAVVAATFARGAAVLTQLDGTARVPDRRTRGAAPSAVMVERLGFRATRARVAPGDRMVVVDMQRVAWDTLTSSRQVMPGCPVAFSDGAGLWQQIRAALRGGQIGRGGRVAAAHISRNWQVVNANQRQQSTRLYVENATVIQGTPAPAQLFAGGFVRQTPYTREFLAPNDAFFLDDAFTRHYCISAALGGGTGETTIMGIRFTPRTSRRASIDISGVFFVDTASTRLEYLTYQYLRLPDPAFERPGGSVFYAALRDGSHFPVRWAQGIPMPTLSGLGGPGDPERDSSNRVLVRPTVLWTGNAVDSVRWSDGVTYRADSALKVSLSGRQEWREESDAEKRLAMPPIRGTVQTNFHFHPEVPVIRLENQRIVFHPSGREGRVGRGGEFRFDELSAGDTSLVIYDHRLLPVSQRLFAPPMILDLRMESVTASHAAGVRRLPRVSGSPFVSGVVADTTLRPLGKALVRMVGLNTEAHATLNGTFRIAAVPGTYLVVIEAPGHARQIVGATVAANSATELSVWMVPKSQAGSGVSDVALTQFAERLVDGDTSRRLIARDAFGKSDSTMRSVRAIAALVSDSSHRCDLRIEGGPPATIPAAWVRPIDVELIEITDARKHTATCGNALVRAWLRR